MLASEVELRGVRDRHDRHRAGLHRIRNDEVGGLGYRADHIQCDDGNAMLAQLPHGRGDLTTHDGTGQDQASSARQVGDGAHGSGDVVFADECDGVDADALAAQVVSVSLTHRTERYLGHLRTAANNDDSLAEDPVERVSRLVL